VLPAAAERRPIDGAAGSGLRGALAATRLGHLEGVRRLAGRGRGGAPGPGAVR
jgi:hypothetical protein